MLDPFSPLNDLDQLRSRYDVLRLLRQNPDDTTVYAVRARGGERHFLVGMWPAGDAAGGRAGALQPWQAHTVRPLEHPKLMTIHAVHHLQGGGLAIAIDRRRGRTLTARMAEADPINAEEAGRILRDVAEALHYLHLRGTVHRGVRPEAVFLDQDAGVARLAPFELEPGVRRQTDEHRAPELFRRGGTYDDRAASPRTDLYALGVLGCKMLSDSHLSSPEAAARSARTPRDRLLAGLPADLPPALRAAIEGCLARRPRRRWQDAAQLLACLQGGASPASAGRRWAGVAHLEGRARRFANAVPGRPSSRSGRPRALGLVLVAGGAALGVAGAAGVLERPPAPAPGAHSSAVAGGAPANALLSTSDGRPRLPAASIETAPEASAGKVADLGAIRFLQIEADSVDRSPAAPQRVSAPAESRSSRQRAGPPRVVLLGEPIEP